MFKHPSSRILARSAATLLLGSLITTTVNADVLYWDTNADLPGSGAVTGAWGIQDFWTLDPTGSILPGAYVPGSDVIFSAGNNATTGTVSVDGTQSANSITFDDNVAVTLSGGVSLTLGDGGVLVSAGNAAVNTISTAVVLDSAATGPAIVNAGTGLLTLGAITGSATVGNVQNITFSSTAAGGITVGGVIADGTGGGKVGLTVNNTGTGVLNLGAAAVANTFTGGLNVTSGIVRVANANALGANTNAVTLNGGIILSGGAFTLAQPMTIGANGGTISTVGSGGKLILSGALTGSGTFFRAGDRITQFTGATTTNDLQITIANLGFTGSVVLNGGATEVPTTAFGNGSAPNNHITINNGAELVTNGSAMGHRLFVNHGAILTGNGTGTKEFSSQVAANNTFNIRMGDFHAANNRNLTFSGPLTGSGAFTMISAPTLNPTAQYLTFSGNNSGYTAKMRASAGYSIVFNQAASIAAGGLEVLSNGGQLGTIGFAYNFGASVPAFTNTRATGVTTGGVFGINAVLPAATSLDMATLGGGGMFLGTANNAGTYAAATLGADNGFYRLGGGNGTLTFTGANALTGANDLVIHDPRVNGGGTVVLAAPTNFTGSTTVRAGTLRLDFAAATAPADNIIAATSPLTMQGGSLSLTGRAGGPSSQTFASTAVTGAASSTLTASGSNVISLHYGNINRSSGSILNNASITATAGYTTGAIATTASSNNGGNILGTWAFAGTGANTRYATRNDGSLTGQVLAVAGTTVADAAALVDTTGVENYNLTLATGAMPAGTYANTIRYTGAAATTAPGTSFQVNGLLNAGTGAWTIGTGGVTIGADRELVINAASGAITVSGIIANNAAGASAVTITGPSGVTLSAANTFNGGLNVTGGTVSFTTSAHLGAANSVVTLNGGTLNSTIATGTTAFAHPIVVGPNGGTFITAGSSTNGKWTLAGGLLTGSGTFTRQSGAALQITGANPGFTGQFNVYGLTEMSAVNALGVGIINLGVGGELNVNIGVQPTNPLIFNGGTMSGQHTGSGGTVTIPASTTITAASDFRLAGRAFQATDRVFGFTLAAPISGSGSMSVLVGTNASNNRQTILLSGNNSAWSGNINTTGASPSNGITLRLGSTTALGDSTGVTTIAPNSLLDLNGVTLANGEPLVIGGSGPLSFPTALTNEAATPATFSGPITLTANTVMGSNGGGHFTLSGEISGAFGVTKGFGPAQTLTLGGNNSYTGPTTLTAGTLLVTGSIASSAVTTSGSSTLGGTGSTGDATIGTGSTLAPGVSGIGTLGTGNLTLISGSIFSPEFNSTLGTFDQVNVTGNLSIDLGGTALLNFADLGANTALALNSVFTLIDYSGTWNGGIFSGYADDSTFTLGANEFQISYNGTGADSAVTLTVVPEPGAAFALLSGLGVLAACRRSRRRP